MTLATSILRRGFCALTLGCGLVALLWSPAARTGIAGDDCHSWLAKLDRESPSPAPETVAALATLDPAPLPGIRWRLVCREAWAHRLRRLAARWAPGGSPPDPHEVETTRLGAARFVETLGNRAGAYLPDLAEALRVTGNGAAREVVLNILRSLGDDAIPTCCALALDGDGRVRAGALGVLADLAPGMPEKGRGRRVDIAAICAASLTSNDEAVLLASIGALARLGESANLAVDTVLPHLDHPNREVRGAAAAFLGRFPEACERSLRPLIRTLDDAEPAVQTAAATAVGRFGDHAAEAVPALARLLETGSTQVAVAAAHALGRVGPPAASSVRVIASRLRGEGAPLVIRSSAATALGRIARVPEIAVPALTGVVRHPEPYLSGSAIRALTCFGEDASGAIPELVEALHDPHESVRVLAAGALGAIGPAAAAAIPALQAARNNNQSVMSLPVIAAVARIDGKAGRVTDPDLAEVSPGPPNPATSAR